MSTPTDALKDVRYSVKETLGYVTDHLAGNEILPEDHFVFDMLDGLRAFVSKAVAQHVNADNVRTYADGSPVYIPVDLPGGSIAYYRPRHDGDFTEWRALFDRTTLHIVDDRHPQAALDDQRTLKRPDGVNERLRGLDD